MTQAAVSTRICFFDLISKEKSDNRWGLEGAIFYPHCITRMGIFWNRSGPIMGKFRFQWLDMEPTHQMLLLAFLRLTVPMAGRRDPRTSVIEGTTWHRL